MSPSNETLKDDIAFMTSLARDGAKPTYAGGEFLLAAGLTFGGASFAVAASSAGLLPISMNWIWLGSLILFALWLPILIIRSRRDSTYRAIGNRAVGEAWTAIGFAIFTLAVASGIVGWRLHTGMHMAMFAPIILALYGVGWSVSAALSERRWNKVLAIGSYVSAVIVALLVDSMPLTFLAYGIALVFLAAIPGAVWMRLHRQAQG